MSKPYIEIQSDDLDRTPLARDLTPSNALGSARRLARQRNRNVIIVWYDGDGRKEYETVGPDTK